MVERLYKLAKWQKGLITQENATRLWNLLPLSAETLVEQGPDLIDSFVSGYSLENRASSFVPEGADWLDRLQSFLESRRGRPTPLHIDHGEIRPAAGTEGLRRVETCLHSLGGD